MPRVTTKLIEDCINRALGMKVNELRLYALRRGLDEIEMSVPVEPIFTKALELIAGQFGHDAITEETSPVDVKKSRLQAALKKAASAWKAEIEGDRLTIKVIAPKRTKRTTRR